MLQPPTTNVTRGWDYWIISMVLYCLKTWIELRFASLHSYSLILIFTSKHPSCCIWKLPIVKTLNMKWWFKKKTLTWWMKANQKTQQFISGNFYPKVPLFNIEKHPPLVRVLFLADQFPCHASTDTVHGMLCCHLFWRPQSHPML